MGGVYSATAESVFQKRPYHHFDINIGFPCAPENSEKLSKALIDIIADIRTNGIANKYIEQVRQSLMGHRSAQLNTNEYWLYVLSGAWIDQDDPKFISSYFEDIRHIGKHDLDEAALKYLDLKQYTRMIVKP
jgi:zinc protease